MKRNAFVFDIETDGLDPTKIHVLSYNVVSKYGDVLEQGDITDYDEMREIIKSIPQKDAIVVGHNIVRFDIPALEKILKIKFPKTMVCDTLLMSQFLYAPIGRSHGLEEWGKRLEIQKVQIKDWENQSINDYIKRCRTDVEINTTLWNKIRRTLKLMYIDEGEKLINYLQIKAENIKLVEDNNAWLNIQKATKHHEKLSYETYIKRERLKKAMPRTKKLRSAPSQKYKKDGTPTKRYSEWLALLEELGLPEDTDVIYEEPNPDSDKQLKAWLFSLGWEPDEFNEGSNGQVPRIKKKGETELTESVKELAKKEPAINELADYFVLKHRRDIFKDFIDFEEDKKISMRIGGVTKTLRVAHKKPIVNLPKPNVFYGKEVRSVLVAPKGAIMYGADLKGLEDRTKQHFIYPYDPEYVKEMQVPGFDPHIDIAVRSGLLDEKSSKLFKKLDKKKEEEQELTKEEQEEYERIKAIRSMAKTVNFSSTYKVGAAKISRTLKISLDEAKNLLDGFWKRNWAIKVFEKDVEKRKFGEYTYVKNPLSGIWMPLTADKDIFSAVNQSAGAYVFDIWMTYFVKLYRKKFGKNPYLWLQYHDELSGLDRAERKPIIKQLLKEAEKRMNDKLKMNVYIPVDIQFGDNYAEVH